MALYIGDTKIKELYLGSTKIKEAYLGSTPVYKSTHYDPDEVVFESSTPGQYTLDLLDDGNYEVICIGGGGGGVDADGRDVGGGSGAGFDCIFELTKGSYPITIGVGGTKTTGANRAGSGGSSKFGTAYALRGTGGYVRTTTQYEVGVGGDAPTIPYTIISTVFNTTGNDGKAGTHTAAGGYSVYDGTETGYGAGGSNTTDGYGGYVKVIYKGS
jgi:hypothetical protein